MRNGINNKTLKNIKKITAFSLFCSPPCFAATDIYIFCRLLLACAQFHLLTMGLNLDASVSLCNTKKVDRRMLAAIILECCALSAKASGFVKIKNDEQNIYIIYSGAKPTKPLKRLIISADALHLCVFKGDLNIIKIPCADTEKKAEKITGGIDFLLDPLSIIKIFLSTALD